MLRISKRSNESVIWKDVDCEDKLVCGKEDEEEIEAEREGRKERWREGGSKKGNRKEEGKCGWRN